MIKHGLKLARGGKIRPSPLTQPISFLQLAEITSTHIIYGSATGQLEEEEGFEAQNMKITREMMMMMMMIIIIILLFVACSTPWVKPVLARLQPDDAWLLLQLSPEPQQGSGHGAPMTSIAGIEVNYARIEEEILACFAPLLKHKWCIDELQGSLSVLMERSR